MGLKALTESIVQDLPTIAHSYRDGLPTAWLAASPPGTPQQQVQANAFALQDAATTVARGHITMFVLLLMGIVAHLKPYNSSRYFMAGDRFWFAATRTIADEVILNIEVQRERSGKSHDAFRIDEGSYNPTTWRLEKLEWQPWT
jgi:hypothetical protein